jgi:hypothetical protein
MSYMWMTLTSCSARKSIPWNEGRESTCNKQLGLSESVYFCNLAYRTAEPLRLRVQEAFKSHL